LFTELAIGPQVTRVRWAQARLRFAEGFPHEATVQLRTVIEELTRHGLVTDAALAAIDVAEILHGRGRTRDIPAVLAAVVTTFTRAGKLTSALTALGYLRASAASNTITPGVVSEVRRFVRRAERRPNLPFAPPQL
jgi:hypothetical protein